MRWRGGWALGAARAALLCVAVAAAVAGARAGSRRGAAGGVADGRFVCPMHPEVTQSTPGECPLCGMALTLAAPLGATVGAGSAQPVDVPRYGTDEARRHLFSQVVDAAAWVERPGVVVALLYLDELPSLIVGERASFVPTGRGGGRVAVALTGDPPAPWDRSTSLVRLRLEDDGGAGALDDAGAVGRVEFARRNLETVAVPSAAVLHVGDEAYVLVSRGGTLTRRPIVTGRRFGGLTTVVSGVAARESVVSMNAFFMDAEQLAQPGGAPP